MRTLRQAIPYLVIAIALFYGVISAFAQDTHKALRNEDVIKLQSAGLSDETILLSIDSSKTNFDTSPDGLIALSKAGVHKPVIDAMIRAGLHHAVVSPSSKSSDAAQNPNQLSDSFAKAALKALSSIEGDVGQPTISNGSISVPRHTQEQIDEADSEAQNSSEKQVVKALNQFFLGRLKNNMSREIFKLNFYGPDAEVKASEAMSHDAGMQRMVSAEAACSQPLEGQIRSRHLVAIPDSCLHLFDTETTPTAAVSGANAPSDQAALALMGKVVEALGGREAIDKVTSYKQVSSNTEILVVFPDKVRLTVQTGSVKQVILLAPGHTETYVNGKAVPLPPQFAEEGRRIVSLGLIAIAKHVTDSQYHFTLLSPQNLGGKTVQALSISNAAGTAVWLVDPDSGKVLQATRKGFLPSGQVGETTQSYSDWKTYDGINLPSTVSTVGPNPTIAKTLEMLINPSDTKMIVP